MDKARTTKKKLEAKSKWILKQSETTHREFSPCITKRAHNHLSKLLRPKNLQNPLSKITPRFLVLERITHLQNIFI